MAENKLKATLEQEDIMQIQLSHHCSVSIGTINRACNQKRTPSPTIRYRILKSINELTGKTYQHDDIF